MHVQPIALDTSKTHEPCLGCDARQRSVCSEIDEADLAQLSATSVGVEYQKHEVFIVEGEPATDFYNVKHGTAKMFKLLPDGRQQITGFAGAGFFLGLAVQHNYAFSAQAIEDVRLCRFSRIKLRHLLDDFPQLERRLFETACKELAAAQEQMLLLGRKSAAERLASFLLGWSRETPVPVDPDLILLPMTRGEIADYLGLTIETVSRTFSLFRRELRISTPSNSEVIVLDRQWMEAAATGSLHEPAS